MSPRAERIFETCLYAADLSATVDFYRCVLGLEVISDFFPRGVVLRCGAGALLLFDPDETKKSHPRMPSHGTEGTGHVAFLATEEELPAWREHLAQCGVEIETEVAWEVGGTSIYFRDPGGNVVELAPPTLWGGGWV